MRGRCSTTTFFRKSHTRTIRTKHGGYRKVSVKACSRVRKSTKRKSK